MDLVVEQTSTTQRQRARLIMMIVLCAVLLAGLVLVLVLVLIGRSGSSATEAPKGVTAGTVTMEATGDADRAAVTYSYQLDDGAGSSSTQIDQHLPWQYTLTPPGPVEGAGDFTVNAYTFSVSNGEGETGAVRCRLWVGTDLVADHSAQGEGASVECSSAVSP